MEWPAQSPKLNSTENLRGDKNAVSEAKPKNSQELWNAVSLSWAEIPVSRWQKLVNCCASALHRVIKNNGYATKY